MRRPLAVSALAVSAALVLAVAFPWGDLVDHPHWSRVGWVPFRSWPVRPLDIAGNLLLCVPLGAVGGLAFSRGVLVAGALAFALSMFVEAAQLYTHSRFPSATDVVANVVGAVLAAALARVCLLPRGR